ncbi:hypothetical protein G6F35_008547 [Rhizopus arrhizus]|nr:hypothetical protein G6F35_008547 [Rhizopus arrhizus]
MNLSGPFIRRPIGTALLAIGLFMVGLICYLRLGVSALPNIEIPVIFVHASQSGADAATMATTVTAPLERHLGQLPGIDRMRSSSSEGSSLVFMIFQSGHNIDSAALDVQTAINSAQADLPSGMGSPMYQKANPNDDPVIAIALTSQTQSADELYNVADSLLAQRIRQISGVASVDIAGASTPAVRVDVNLRLMNALGLTADDLRNAVRAANVTSPTGFLSDGNTTTAIIANDSVARAADFADLVVKTQGDGRVIRLKDIANVYDGQQDAYQAAWFDHKPAVVMYVFTRAGANIVETVDRVKAQIPTLRDYLQPGTTMTPADHPADQPGDGGADHGAVPAPAGTDADRRGDRAAVAGGCRAGDVRDGLHPEQPEHAGAGDRDRLRGRRCDRGDREHHAPPRRGHAAHAGGADRGPRDRLHHPA